MLETNRLILRRWKSEDSAPFFALNSDALAMQHMPKTLTRQESDDLIEHNEKHLDEYGYGAWAAELKETGQCIGSIMLKHVLHFKAHFTPAIEVGWRLLPTYWNVGLATEGAREALRFAFEELKLSEVVAYTVPANASSRRVMEKLGMTYSSADDFDHPILTHDHPLKRHVLYRITPTTK